MTDESFDPIRASDDEAKAFLARTGCEVTAYPWGRSYKWGGWEYGVSNGVESEGDADRDAARAWLEHSGAVARGGLTAH